MAPNDTERAPGDVGLRLTYAEIAERLGISGDAARQLVRRRGWLRIIPNRRGATTTVIVPEDDIASEQRRDTRSADDGGTTPDGNRLELRLALTSVDRLSQQLAEASTRIDQAERRAEAADRRADRAEADRDGERARVETLRDRLDALRGDLDMARTQATTAHDMVRTLREAEADRKARGLLARLGAAVRGQ